MVYTMKCRSEHTVSWLGQTRPPFESPEGLVFPCMREAMKATKKKNTDLDVVVVVVVVGDVLRELSLCAARHGEQRSIVNFCANWDKGRENIS